MPRTSSTSPRERSPSWADGTVELAGYARDRHAAVATPGSPVVLYGQRAHVTLPATGESLTGCGNMLPPVGGLQQGSDGVVIDGLQHDGSGADPAQAGRFYDGVVALSGNGYAVAGTVGPDGAAWVQRYTAAGAPNGARIVVPRDLPARTRRARRRHDPGRRRVGRRGRRRQPADDARPHLERRLLVLSAERSRVAGGNDTGQALAVLPDGRVIVGGSANLGGKTAFGLTRFTAAACADDSFGTTARPRRRSALPRSTATSPVWRRGGSLLGVSGRLTTPPAWPSSPPATARRASRRPHRPRLLPPRSASPDHHHRRARHRHRERQRRAPSWWLEYGTTTGYGGKTAPVAIPAPRTTTSMSASP